MDTIIGYQYLPFSKLKLLKTKLCNFLKKEQGELFSKKEIVSSKKIVYLGDKKRYYYNNEFHNNLDSLYNQKQYFYFINNSNRYNLEDKILNHIYFYNYENKMKTCLISTYDSNRTPINFLNDIFDKCSSDYIYHLFNQPTDTLLIHEDMLIASSFLLKLLCEELKKQRQNKCDIDTKLISKTLDNKDLFLKNDEYLKLLYIVPIDRSLGYKHYVLKGIIENQYLEQLYEAEKNGAISNASFITIHEMIEKQYNCVIRSVPISLKLYIDTILKEKEHNIQIFNSQNDNDLQKELELNEASFFEALKKVNTGHIDVILSDIKLSENVHAYILKEYGIKTNQVFENKEHILFSNNKAHILNELALVSHTLNREDFERQQQLMQNIPYDFFIYQEEKHLTNILNQNTFEKDSKKTNRKKYRIFMDKIIGYYYKPYSRSEKIKLKLNKIFRKEILKVPLKKEAVFKTCQNVVYFHENHDLYYQYHELDLKYHFNYFSHCLSQLKIGQQFIFITNEKASRYLNKTFLFDTFNYKNQHGITICFYHSYPSSELHHTINFFNDLFDNVLAIDIFHMLNKPFNEKVSSVRKKATTILLNLLCCELKILRMDGKNINQALIIDTLKNFSLFSASQEYQDLLNEMPENTSLQFKHQLIQNYIVGHYLADLFESENFNAISNNSNMTLSKIFEYKYNYVAFDLPFAIQKYIDYLLKKNKYDLTYIENGKENLAFKHHQNYSYQHIINIDIKSEDAFFHLIEQAKSGNIELIFSKSNYNQNIFNYILNQYNISPLNETFKQANHLLFNQQGAFILNEINMPSYNFTEAEIEYYLQKLKNIPGEFGILYEKKYFDNLFDLKENITMNTTPKHKKKI